MKNGELKKLVKEDTYQVFLLASPCNLPLSFAPHYWFVVNKKGVLTRWEVLFREKSACQTRWGHLHKDAFPPFLGIEIIPFYERFLWKARLFSSIEGEVARQCAEFLEASPQTYPHSKRYSLLGPNSNTYTHWVLGAFPALGRLPANTIGKRYN